ncbi:MAG: hypothetical protein EBR82_68850 [Caulobacteraceae bacterium]|nr:hypothetical protein [Caulobacteraceae bacterium]
MTQLYRATAYEVIRDDGADVHVQVGEPVTVQGAPMVRLAHGVLVPATGWHATREAALAEAATTVEAWGNLLLEQAARLRQEASDV